MLARALVATRPAPLCPARAPRPPTRSGIRHHRSASRRNVVGSRAQAIPPPRAALPRNPRLTEAPPAPLKAPLGPPGDPATLRVEAGPRESTRPGPGQMRSRQERGLNLIPLDRCSGTRSDVGTRDMCA